MYYNFKAKFDKTILRTAKYNIGNNNKYSLYYTYEIGKYKLMLNKENLFVLKHNEIKEKDYIFISRNKNSLYNKDNFSLLNTFDKTMNMNSKTFHLKYYKNKINLNTINILIERFPNELNVFQNIYLNKYYNGSTLINKYITLDYHKNKKMSYKEDCKFVGDKNTNIILNKTYNISKSNSSTKININDTISLYKDYNSINDINYFISLYRDNNSIFKNNHDMQLYLNYKSVLENNYAKKLCIYSKSIIYDNNLLNLYYKSKEIVYEKYYRFAYKNSKDFSILDITLNAEQKNKNIHIDECKTFDKDIKYAFVIDESNFLNKDIKQSYIYNNVNVSKKNKNMYLDFENKSIKKLYKDTHIEDDLFLNALYKNTMIEDYIFISKLNKRIDIFNNSLYVDKYSKPLYKNYNNKFINKSSMPISFNNLYKLKCKGDNAFLNDIINLNIDDKELCIDKNINIGIKDRYAYIYYKYINFKKDICNTNVLQSESTYKNRKDLLLDYDNTNASKDKKDVYLPDCSFVSIIHFEDTKEPTFEDGKIDELLLPHKDYKYSNYLQELLNNDGTLKGKYIKGYDTTTGEYIVNIPIENPINIYADIGRDYIDLDTNVLYNVIYNIRLIYKENMMKYIHMSAQDSLKDIIVKIDLLMSEIYKNDSKKRYHSLRSIQLFRWYSEMAILNNCDYYLKFDTKKSIVNYYSKSLGELENSITLNNMHINDEYIMTPIDESKACSITFINTNNMQDLPQKLSLKLYNINIESIVILYDGKNTEIKEYNPGIHNLKLDLKNTITIRCVPKNKYQSINIANIVIDGITVRGFTVRYKGTFGEINSVMKELLDYLLITGEVNDELKEKLGDISAVTIAIDTMIQYYNFHHKNKDKGKRLITKK